MISSLNEIGDSMLNAMPIAPPTIEELLASPLFKFITFAANVSGNSHSFTEIFVTAVLPFFLKAKSAAGKDLHVQCWLKRQQDKNFPLCH